MNERVPDASAETPRSRIGAAALLLAGSVLLSRVIGWLREAVLADRLGASAAMDAYRAAFQLPDMLNYLLAGSAFAVAFIPVYTRIRETRGSEAAGRLFANVLGATAALVVLATALLWWFAPPLVELQFGGFSEETRALCTRLTRIMLPAQIFLVTGGVVRAVLMADGRFGAQAAAPLLYNGGIIGCGLLLSGRLGAEGFAWGVLVGAAVGSFGLPLYQAVGSRHVRLRVSLSLRDPDLLQYLKVAAPLMIGLSLLTVDEWYGKWLGDDLGEGVVARIGFARQVALVPVAVVGQAVAAAALPTLARLFSEGRRQELDGTLLRTLQIVLALSVLIAAGVLAHARPAIEIILRRGEFTLADADATAALLQVMALGIPGWIVSQVAARAFFARGDTLRPMLLGTAMALLSVPLYLALRERYDAPGLALAGALGISLNAAVTLAWARRLHGGPPLGSLLATGLRVVPAAVVGALAAMAAQRGDPGHLGAAVDLALGGAAFAATALPLAWLLGGDAARDGLLRLLRLRR